MYETDSVDVQGKILTENFLQALVSCAPFETKLLIWPHSKWITEDIQNEIKTRNIFSHEYKSIMDDAAIL